MLKKGLSLLLALCCMLPLTACWDHVEVNNMLIAAGIGLDLDDEGYRAVVEVVDVAAEGSENIASKLVEGSGETMYAAIQNAMVMTGGSLYTNHCKVIVIGDKLARQGINEVVDMVLRSPNFRKALDVLVAKETTAKAILTQKTVKDDIVSFELEKMLTSNQDTLNTTRVTGVYQLHEAFISPCPTAVVPVVSIRENGRDDVLYIQGTAVFWTDHLQGYLSGQETELYNILRHTVTSGSIAAHNEALSAKPIEAKLMRSTVRLTPGIVGDRLRMQVSVHANMILQGGALLTADLAEESTVKQLESSLAQQLERDAIEVISRAQTDYRADIFDFSKEFERHYHREWEALIGNWPSHFQDMEVVVDASVSVSNSGLIGNYMPYTDAANALP